MDSAQRLRLAVITGGFVGSFLLSSAHAGLSASFGVSSEYVFRGLTSGDPQVWGAVDYSHDTGFYAGTWVSNTSFGPAPVDSNGDGALDDVQGTKGNEEVDYYAGWGNDVFDIGAIYYAFPSQPSQGNTGITEIYGGVSLANFAGYVWYAPAGIDGPDDDEYAYVDLNLDMPLTETTSLSAHVGILNPIGDNAVNRSDGTDDADLDYGLSYNVGDFFMALTYLDGSAGGFSTVAGYSWSIPIE